MRMDEALLRKGLFELAAQLAHVYVDRSLLLAVRPVPHHGVQLLAAYDPATAAREGGQQAQLTYGERQRTPASEHQELPRPDLELALPQDFLSCRFHRDSELL